MEPCFLTASQAARLYETGELTVTELATSTLARIKARDEAVKGWAYLDEDLVMKRARDLDSISKAERGPLHGITIAVKDVIYTKDMPTQHNSPMYRESFPEIDAACIMTLRSLGALIFGKTTTTEFAASSRGPATQNPYNPECTPGGSSSGSGAVIGDFQCQIGLGTQTVGSTIRPGSYNNIFAMKPTWNAISREGVKMLAVSLDTLGLHARSAEDLELLCDAFRLQDDIAPEIKPISAMKIGICKSPAWTPETVTPSLETVWAQAQDLLKAAGAELVEIDLSPDFDGLFDVARTVMWCEARSAFLSDYLHTPESCHDDFKEHATNGKGLTREEQLTAYDRLNRLKPVWDKIADGYDAVLTPSATGEAPGSRATTGSAIFCGTWTGLQAPSLNVPGFAGETGMPIGLSLVSGRYRDQKLVAVAKEVAKVFKGAHGDKIRQLPGVPSGLL